MFRTLVIASLLLFTQAGLSQSNKKPLDDSTLDRVTAAGVSATVSQGVVSFTGQVPTKNGLVTSTGTLAVQTAPISTTTTMGTLSLNGNAQQNLSSLININAVNSQINVLLNLNINIDSTVGSIVQSNLSGKH
jgi:negative regulator of sigma E activity